VDRREFLRRVLGGAAAAAVLPALPLEAAPTTFGELVTEYLRPAMKPGLQMVPLDAIRIDWSKWHRAKYPGESEMFGHLVESIKSAGVVNPIMVEPDCTLIDGTYRVEAARAAGLTEIPAIVRDDLTLLNNVHFNLDVNGTPLRLNFQATQSK
jgi:hypothetical protein